MNIRIKIADFNSYEARRVKDEVSGALDINDSIEVGDFSKPTYSGLGSDTIDATNLIITILNTSAIGFVLKGVFDIVNSVVKNSQKKFTIEIDGKHIEGTTDAEGMEKIMTLVEKIISDQKEQEEKNETNQGDKG